MIVLETAAGPSTLDALSDLVRLLRGSRRLVLLTGAGVSTGSGIPDYRDERGEWKRKLPMRYQEFVASEAARRRYWARATIGFARIREAEAGPAHRALASLERLGRLHYLITQNVDGLHQKAGSRNVMDLHGRLDRVRCLGCGDLSSRDDHQRRLLEANPRFRALEAPLAPDGDADLDAADIERFRLPECLGCSGVLKPDVVFFGESVPRERVEEGMTRVDEADLLLVAGSSLMVWSGYRFVRRGLEQGIPVAAVNLGKTRADAELTLKVPLDCGEALEAVARLLVSR